MAPPGIGDIPNLPHVLNNPNPAVTSAASAAAMSQRMEELGTQVHARSPKGMVEQIAAEIKEFESNLPNQFDLVFQLLGAAGQIVMRLRAITSYESGLMVFSGEAPDGTARRVLQHVSQVAFALGGIDRTAQDSPRPRVGFRTVPEGNP